MEQQLIKKRKKKQIISFNYKQNIDVDEISENISDLRTKLIKLFKHHIGFEEGLTGWELLEHIYKDKFYAMNDYEKFFYYNILKIIIKKLRRERVILIINQKRKFFVLKTMEEFLKLSSLLDRDIKSMEKLQEDGYEWVVKEKWRNL